MAGIQAIIRAMLVDQMEEIIQLFQGNKTVLTAPVEELVINKAQSEEGNYNKTVNQAKPRRVRRNITKE